MSASRSELKAIYVTNAIPTQEQFALLIDADLNLNDDTSLPASLTGSSLTSVGTISSGTWQGTAIDASYIGNLPASKITSGEISHERGGLEADVSAYSGLLKISGGTTSSITDNSTNWDSAYTHSQVTSGNPHSVSKSDVGLGSVENTAISTWAGSANLTTLGTIASGVWQGTAIDATYVGNLPASKITSGEISHERGGLEADVSAYSGLLKISGGTTSSITDNSTNWDSAYTHSQVTSGNPHSVSKSDVGLGSVENTAISTWAGSSNITTLGTIGTGIWQGTVVDHERGGLEADVSVYSGLLKISGGTTSSITDNSTNWDSAYTHSQVTSGNPHSVSKSDVGLGSVENTAISTWAGSANITTLGTIGTGTWQGTAIADGYISSAAAWNAKVDTTGTPADNQVAFFSDADTIEGDSNFTWDGTRLVVKDANTSTFVGFNAGLNDDGNNANTAFGYDALKGFSTLSGDHNCAFGIDSLEDCTSGGANCGFGWNALNSNTTGSYNTGIGTSAMNLNQSGSNNTAIGYGALGSAGSSTYNNCVAIGYFAGKGRKGTGNIFIGYMAGELASDTTTNNVLYIDNSDTTTPLIYGEFNNDKIIINGQLEATTGSSYGDASLVIDQDDADEPFINYEGTSAASAANNISTWTTGNSIQGFIRININGTDRWMPFYDAPTS